VEEIAVKVVLISLLASTGYFMANHCPWGSESWWITIYYG